ncbi:hypothetical protein Celaphus_00000309, partial [Cervus elaphus hippelaphus]
GKYCIMDLTLSQKHETSESSLLFTVIAIAFIALVIIHLLFLHDTDSNNPTRISFDMNKIPFHPYCTKISWCLVPVSDPTSTKDPDNYIPANPPQHSRLPYQTRWILLIAICNPTINFQQTRRCTSLNLLNLNFTSYSNTSYIKTMTCSTQSLSQCLF